MRRRSPILHRNIFHVVYDLEEPLKEGLNPPSPSLEKPPPKLLPSADEGAAMGIIQYFAIAAFW